MQLASVLASVPDGRRVEQILVPALVPEWHEALVLLEAALRVRLASDLVTHFAWILRDSHVVCDWHPRGIRMW